MDHDEDRSDEEQSKDGAAPLRLEAAVQPLRLATPVERAPGRPPAPNAGATPGAAAAPPPTPAPDAGWSGERLRQAREARGLTVRQVAERTKVMPVHIANVEADAFEQLPAAVYLRGILMALAKELRLDGQKVSRSYLDAMRAATGR